MMLEAFGEQICTVLVPPERIDSYVAQLPDEQAISAGEVDHRRVALWQCQDRGLHDPRIHDVAAQDARVSDVDWLAICLVQPVRVLGLDVPAGRTLEVRNFVPAE